MKRILAATVLASGCHLIGGAGDLDFVDVAGPGGASTSGVATGGDGGNVGGGTNSAGGSGGNGSGGNGSGGEGECTSASQCDGDEGDCLSKDCINQTCVYDYAPTGTDCDDNGGSLCNGNGICVAVGTDCDDPSRCVTDFCEDDVCCVEECGGVCETCAANGNPGFCTPHAATTSPEGGCGAGFCDGSGECTNVTHTWSKSWGAFGDQVGLTIGAIATGESLVAGSFVGDVEFVPNNSIVAQGVSDVFMLKLSSTGVPMWSVRFGETGTTTPAASAVDGTSFIVAGTFDGDVDFGGGDVASQGAEDIFLVKLEATGAVDWHKLFGGTGSQVANGVAVAADGAIVIVGGFDGTLPLGPSPLMNAGAEDAFIAKFDANGSHEFSTKFGDTSAQAARAVAIDSDGNIIVAGDFAGQIDFGGDNFDAGTSRSGFLVKFDSQGQHLASIMFGDTVENQTVNDVAADSDGNIWLCGVFDGDLDIDAVSLSSGGDDGYLIALDPDLVATSGLDFGTTAGTEEPRGVSVDPFGNALLVGRFEGSVDFGGGVLSDLGSNDAFVAKFARDGTHLFSAKYGGTSDEAAHDVAADSAGNLVFTGMFRLQLDLGGGTLTTEGNADVFAAGFTP